MTSTLLSALYSEKVAPDSSTEAFFASTFRTGTLMSSSAMVVAPVTLPSLPTSNAKLLTFNVYPLGAAVSLTVYLPGIKCDTFISPLSAVTAEYMFFPALLYTASAAPFSGALLAASTFLMVASCQSSSLVMVVAPVTLPSPPTSKVKVLPFSAYPAGATTSLNVYLPGSSWGTFISPLSSVTAEYMFFPALSYTASVAPFSGALLLLASSFFSVTS